ncbi:hypothetical protein KY495_10920 [Massilia sp. PAMC28688]|uniref:hypothetical protein n=1 Tax=Massilia sp. PAMC28688 TaxID=2861283 RepID=UPI001C63929F|nr:hypothetical protein [Massilia sp. PAMC28688]QYF95608.1 hypothetical protein KY495_10920 [Massilia sp. PAMC28688]
MRRLGLALLACMVASPWAAGQSYESAFAGYRAYVEPSVADWKATNAAIAQVNHAHAGHDMGQHAASADDPHAGHDMSKHTTPKVDAHAGDDMGNKAPAADPHAGHNMPMKPAQPKADPHAGHDMSKHTKPATDPHAGHQH